MAACRPRCIMGLCWKRCSTAVWAVATHHGGKLAQLHGVHKSPTRPFTDNQSSSHTRHPQPNGTFPTGGFSSAAVRWLLERRTCSGPFAGSGRRWCFVHFRRRSTLLSVEGRRGVSASQSSLSLLWMRFLIPLFANRV